MAMPRVCRLRVDQDWRSRHAASLCLAAIASFGNLTAYPYPVQPQPDTADFGASFVVYDNLWGVNYILWFPFNATAPEAFASSSEYFPTPWNSHLLSRFTITFGR
jgi:hypothetical protein